MGKIILVLFALTIVAVPKWVFAQWSCERPQVMHSQFIDLRLIAPAGDYFDSQSAEWTKAMQAQNFTCDDPVPVRPNKRLVRCVRMKINTEVALILAASSDWADLSPSVIPDISVGSELKIGGSDDTVVSVVHEDLHKFRLRVQWREDQPAVYDEHMRLIQSHLFDLHCAPEWRATGRRATAENSRRAGQTR